MLISAVATDKRAPWSGVFAPLAIGGFIFTAAVTAGSFTSGSFNGAFARSGDLRERLRQALDLPPRAGCRRGGRRVPLQGRPAGIRGPVAGSHRAGAGFVPAWVMVAA